MNSRPARRWAIAAFLTVVTLSPLAACSSGSDDGDDSGASSDMGVSAADAAERAGAEDFVGGGASDGTENETSSKTADSISLVQLNQAIIKTASIEMETDDVAKVVDDVYALAATTHGAVTAANTSTNEKGIPAHARLELKVPVARFDESVAQVEAMGTHPDTQVETQDVTTQVADIESRVKSAEESISQLRLLFSRATKLGQIIVLERELSRREADLEALQAQQRSLAAQTTMSTILVSVELAEEDKKDDVGDDREGFVAGIEQGWDGFVTFTVGTAHAIGLILPLGTLALVVAGLGWWAARRWMPRQGSDGPAAQPSGPAD